MAFKLRISVLSLWLWRHCPLNHFLVSMYYLQSNLQQRGHKDYWCGRNHRASENNHAGIWAFLPEKAAGSITHWRASTLMHTGWATNWRNWKSWCSRKILSSQKCGGDSNNCSVAINPSEGIGKEEEIMGMPCKSGSAFFGAWRC